MTKPVVTEEQILDWADAYFEENGAWPTQYSGKISGADMTWTALDQAFRTKKRGLKKYPSLHQFLKKRRNK